MASQESPQLSGPQIVRELAIYQRIGAGALMAHAAGGTRVWGAFDRERLAGVVAVTREAGANPLAGGFHLWGLYVRPEDRGGSASHALMSTALAWCRQRPCNQGVTLHAHRGNAGALRWFPRFGFERCAEDARGPTNLVAVEPGASGVGKE